VRSEGKQIQQSNAANGQFPASVPLNQEMTARLPGLFVFVDGKQLYSGRAGDFPACAGNQLERQPGEVERNFVRGGALAVSDRIAADKTGVTVKPGKGCVPNHHAAQFLLLPQKLEQLELVLLLFLRQEDQARIDSAQVMSIPLAVVVALIGQVFLPPGFEAFVEQQIELEMDVRALFGNPLACVGRAAHDRDGRSGLDLFARLNRGRYLPEVRINRIDFQTLDQMLDHDVPSVIRESRFVIHINDRAVGRGKDRVRRLALAIALETPDVNPFVKLLAVRANAAEHPAGPGFADGANEESFFASGVQQFAVGGGETKRLRE